MPSRHCARIAKRRSRCQIMYDLAPFVRLHPPLLWFSMLGGGIARRVTAGIGASPGRPCEALRRRRNPRKRCGNGDRGVQEQGACTAVTANEVVWCVDRAATRQSRDFAVMLPTPEKLSWFCRSACS